MGHEQSAIIDHSDFPGFRSVGVHKAVLNNPTP